MECENNSETYCNLFTKDVLDEEDVQALLELQSKLPVLKKEIVNEFFGLVDNSKVVVLTASTGAGKSTQIPGLLYQKLQRPVVCSQPRKLPVNEISKRLAKQYGVVLGKEIGYSSRGDSKISRSSQLTMVTEGILVNKMRATPMMEEYGGIILDEVHERSIDMDILLFGVREIVKQRDDCKVVIMTATAEKETFINYFESQGVKTGFMHVEGSPFDVDVEYLEQRPPKEKIVDFCVRKAYDLCMEPVKEMDKEDILVFLPRIGDLDKAYKQFNELIAGNPTLGIPLKLSSSTSAEDQDNVTVHPASSFEVKRKVIFSTSVAETSITITTLGSVIDSGYDMRVWYHFLSSFDVSDMMNTTKASAKQRKGRVGRVAKGKCYRMYTESDYESFENDIPPKITSEDSSKKLLGLLVSSFYNSGDTLSMKENVMNALITPYDNDRTLDIFTKFKEMECTNGQGKFTELARVIDKYTSILPIEFGRMVIYSKLYTPKIYESVILLSSSVNELTSVDDLFFKTDQVKAPDMIWAGSSVKQNEIDIVEEVIGGFIRKRRKGYSTWRARDWSRKNDLNFTRLEKIYETYQDIKHSMETKEFDDEVYQLDLSKNDPLVNKNRDKIKLSQVIRAFLSRSKALPNENGHIVRARTLVSGRKNIKLPAELRTKLFPNLKAYAKNKVVTFMRSSGSNIDSTGLPSRLTIGLTTH